MHRRSLVLAIVSLLALLALPSFAYTVVLKDGSRVQAQKKYRIVGDKAMITLVNGSESFLLLTQIDIPATDRENQTDYGGTAVVIGSDKSQAPPPVQAPTQSKAPPRSLAELINQRKLDSRVPPAPTVRPQSPSVAPVIPRSARFYETPAGKTSRRAYPNTAVTDSLASYLRGQGLDEFRLYAGSKSGRVLVEATTASEASAFKAITVAANALLEVKGLQVSALELTMETPAGERAGTFLITPEQAAQLSANKIEVSAFYVQNVQF
ncbi:MAG TPA: hypothetical protein VGS22_20040 [Thermoanaerobaculia bacterium]|jgi:hypothetical protein|nr:hypothetical protein [Thermoanaerobaculia bacterium]